MHAMATHFSGVGNTPVEDPRSQEIDNVSEGYFARQKTSNSLW